MKINLPNIKDWLYTFLYHIWLSLSSINFYISVFSTYKGYGYRYISSICVISSFLFIVLCLNQIYTINNYFTQNIINEKTKPIDYIINQIPTINYDGHNISIAEKLPIYITSLNNKKVIVLSANNNKSSYEQLGIPIIMLKNKMIISIYDPFKVKKASIELKYNEIFGYNKLLLTTDIIKQQLSAIFSKLPTVVIFLAYPLLIVILFGHFLFEKSLIACCFYLITNLFIVKTSIQQCIRMVLFANGIFIFLNPVITFFLPQLYIALLILQLWNNLLMMLAILKFSNLNILWFK